MSVSDDRSEGRFEMNPAWAPTLDAAGVFVCIVVLRKDLTRFEYTANHAAKVRNVSKVGSHAK